MIEKWHLQLIWQDIEVLEAIQPILTELQYLTDALAGEKVATINEVKPLLKHIFDDILPESEDDSEVVSLMKSVIKRDLKYRYPDSSPMMSLINKSTFLDPRFKNTFSENENVQVEEEIRSEMMDIHVAISTQEQGHEETQTSNDSIDPKKVKGGGIGAILTRKKSTSISTTTNTAISPHVIITMELELYTNEPEPDLEITVIEWWKQASYRLPLLSQLQILVCMCNRCCIRTYF